MNRLAQESSPYLLQHKNNPVDWFPWGPEAFEKASKENKPIFLSIGYSTCHWCHVMERESFEDHEVADLMNRVFVNIKVDREERPDIDHVYMSVCQAMTGSGGWPLTIVMTPDKKPFFAGTYFAKTTRFGRPGMMDLVPRLDSAWKNQRDQVEDSAKKILEFIETVGAGADETQIEETEIKASIANSKHAFDRVNGGFGDAPKFPSPHNLMFLLRGWKRYRDTQLNEVITKTLHAMRDGGMYDQVGFGFHRYSVDAEWLVPHFEKMLYDQAMLSYAYLEAHQATGETSFAATAREVFEYVLRDLTSPEGAFYSAEDADSEGVEGKFYVWDYEELKANATAAEFKMLEESFGVQRDGNFTDMGEASPHNILHKSGKSFDESAWPALREKLLNLRSKRVRPHLDDKILADWNGVRFCFRQNEATRWAPLSPSSRRKLRGRGECR
ncbi:MAG: thioredoxin domain-containing protein [Bdellovibrionia bacterium]